MFKWCKLEEAKLFASGILLFALKPKLRFLLLKHPTRWDLPKGHLEHSESLKECALREFYEETGIYPDLIKIVNDFEFVTSYFTKTKKYQNRPMFKELTIYLALIEDTPEVRLSEHPMYEWVEWSPPHKIQSETIDPLLEKVHEFWTKQSQ